MHNRRPERFALRGNTFAGSGSGSGFEPVNAVDLTREEFFIEYGTRRMHLTGITSPAGK
jgi:hypothetical protein